MADLQRMKIISIEMRPPGIDVMAEKIRVLYVDDEPSLLDIVKLFLETEGTFAIDTLHSAEEALLQLETRRYDAIISDYQMHGIDGIGFLKTLRARGDTTPFIIFTGRGREAVVIEAINNGVDFYIQKGGEPKAQFAELEHKIRQAVNRKRAEDELRIAYENLTASEEELREQYKLLQQREETIRRDEERLIMAQNIGHTGCWEYNVGKNTIWGSAEGLKLFGYPPVAGEYPITDIETRILDSERAHQALVDLITKEQKYDLEYAINPADGSALKMIHSIARLEKDADGNPVRVIGVIQDITERNRVETALTESESRLRSFIDTTRESVALIDETGKLIEWNPGSEWISGLKKEEVLGKYFWDVSFTMLPRGIHREEHRQAIEQKICNSLRTGSPVSEEPQIIESERPDGTRFFIRQVIFPIKTEKGFRLGLIAQDITDEKMSEIAVKRRDAILQAINFAAECFLMVGPWENHIGNILDRIGTAAEVNRTFIFEFIKSKDPEPIANLRYEWTTHGIRPLIDNSQLKEIQFRQIGLENLYQELLEKNYLPFTVPDLPGRLRAFFDGTDIFSVLIVPIVVNEIPWGFIGFDNARPEPRTYQPIEIEALQAAAGIIGSAIARSQYEKDLKASLENGALLLREVHHRVRNNMQVISSLLSIQSSYITDKTASVFLQETESRIKSMALVHEKLYQSDSFATINIGDYISSLVADLVNTYATDTAITFRSDIQEDITMDLERSIPFGLIINEIVANSIRHAFRGRTSGTIFLSIHESPEGDIRVRIGDNGQGMPDNPEPGRTDTLGMKLISLLTRQIDGKIQIDRDNGTVYTIIIPPQKYHIT